MDKQQQLTEAELAVGNMEQGGYGVEVCRRGYSLEKSSVRAQRMLAGAAEIALEALHFAVHS